MNGCCENFIQCGVRQKDPMFECFEENLKLKAFYNLLRSSQPKPWKKPARKVCLDDRCFCERKRAMKVDKCKRGRELRNQRELLLLQCMCASMGPVKEKLKKSKENKESDNLKDRILKQCLISAIDMVLKAKQRMAMEKKRNAWREQPIWKSMPRRQTDEKSNEKSEMQQIKKCCQYYARAAARDYHKKFLSQKLEARSSSLTGNESDHRSFKCGRKKKKDALKSDYSGSEEDSNRRPVGYKSDSFCEENSSHRQSRSRIRPFSPRQSFVDSCSSGEIINSPRQSRNRLKKTISAKHANEHRSSSRQSYTKLQPCNSESKLKYGKRERKSPKSRSRDSLRKIANSSRPSLHRCKTVYPTSARPFSKDSSIQGRSPLQHDDKRRSPSRQSDSKLQKCLSACKVKYGKKEQKNDKPSRNYKSDASCESDGSPGHSRNRPNKKHPTKSQESFLSRLKCGKKDKNRKSLPTRSSSESSRGSLKRQSRNRLKKNTTNSVKKDRSGTKVHECSSICKSKCNKNVQTHKSKRKSSLCSMRKSRGGYKSDTSCGTNNSHRRNRSNISTNSRRSSFEELCELPKPPLRGGCDYQSTSSWDKIRTLEDKIRQGIAKCSASTDTMNSTRFRGRWFFRGKDTTVQQNFLPPKSSMKSPTRLKATYDRKRLRFNPSKDNDQNAISKSVLDRKFVPSSDLSTDDRKNWTQKRTDLSDRKQKKAEFDGRSNQKQKKTDRSKTPPLNERSSKPALLKERMVKTLPLLEQQLAKLSDLQERLAKVSPANDQLVAPNGVEALEAVKSQSKRSRQRGGETTDTDRECKKNKRFMNKLTSCCSCRRKTQNDPHSCESMQSICSRTPSDSKGTDCEEDALLDLAKKKCSLLSQHEANVCKCCASIAAQTDIVEDNCKGLLSDISLTKVYKDLMVILRPDLLSDNEEQPCKPQKPTKKRRRSSSPKSAKSQNKKSENTCQVPPQVMLYLPASAFYREPRRRARRRRSTYKPRCRSAPTFGTSRNIFPNATSMKHLRDSCLSTTSIRKYKKYIPKYESTQGCMYSCGARKVRVNYLDPERWACLKSRLKVRKNPKPLPKDFVLDTRVSKCDVEEERCRKLKRQHQLEEWRNEIQRKNMESDPFYCPEMNSSTKCEQPGSEVYYVCKPVQSGKDGCSNANSTVFECCYCRCPPKTGKLWKTIDSRFVVNCKNDFSASANVSSNVCSTPSTPCASMSSTHSNIPTRRRSSLERLRKSPIFLNDTTRSSEKSRPSSPHRSRSPPPKKDHQLPVKRRSRSPTPKKDHKLPVKRRSRSPTPKKDHKLPVKRRSRSPTPTKDHKLPVKRRSSSGSSSKSPVRRQVEKNASQKRSGPKCSSQSGSDKKSSARSSSSSGSPHRNIRGGRSPPYTVRSKPSGLTAQCDNVSPQKRKSNVDICESKTHHQECRCDCPACRDAAMKINVDRQRLQCLKATKKTVCKKQNGLASIECSCSLCNNNCCPFSTIEKSYVIYQFDRPEDKFDHDVKTRCQESDSRRTSASSSASSLCRKRMHQRHSWSCTDDFFMLCNKPDSELDGGCGMKSSCSFHKVNIGSQLNPVRDNCFKRPTCINSVDSMDRMCKKKCLYLWTPKTKEGEEEKPHSEKLCTSDGSIIQVVKVKSDELEFLTKSRQFGGCSEHDKQSRIGEIKTQMKQEQTFATSKPIEEQATCEQEVPNQRRAVKIKSDIIITKNRQFGGCNKFSRIDRAKSKMKQKHTSASSKSMTKQVFCYKVKCEQDVPNPSKVDETNTKELIVTACQLQSKKSKAPGPVKIKICESMRPAEEINFSSCKKTRNALKAATSGC